MQATAKGGLGDLAKNFADWAEGKPGLTAVVVAEDGSVTVKTKGYAWQTRMVLCRNLAQAVLNKPKFFTPVSDAQLLGGGVEPLKGELRCLRGAIEQITGDFTRERSGLVLAFAQAERFLAGVNTLHEQLCYAAHPIRDFDLDVFVTKDILTDYDKVRTAIRTVSERSPANRHQRDGFDALWRRLHQRALSALSQMLRLRSEYCAQYYLEKHAFKWWTGSGRGLFWDDTMEDFVAGSNALYLRNWRWLNLYEEPETWRQLLAAQQTFRQLDFKHPALQRICSLVDAVKQAWQALQALAAGHEEELHVLFDAWLSSDEDEWRLAERLEQQIKHVGGCSCVRTQLLWGAWQRTWQQDGDLDLSIPGRDNRHRKKTPDFEQWKDFQWHLAWKKRSPTEQEGVAAWLPSLLEQLQLDAQLDWTTPGCTDAVNLEAQRQPSLGQACSKRLKSETLRRHFLWTLGRNWGPSPYLQELEQSVAQEASTVSWLMSSAKDVLAEPQRIRFVYRLMDALPQWQERLKAKADTLDLDSTWDLSCEDMAKISRYISGQVGAWDDLDARTCSHMPEPLPVPEGETPVLLSYAGLELAVSKERLAGIGEREPGPLSSWRFDYSSCYRFDHADNELPQPDAGYVMCEALLRCLVHWIQRGTLPQGLDPQMHKQFCLMMAALYPSPEPRELSQITHPLN